MRYATFKETFETKNYEKITQIVAQDQKTNRSGAKCRLLFGGPGFFYATLGFRSQIHTEIYYVIKVYGR